MNYTLENIHDSTVPDCVNDFINYLGTIKGKSPNTISGYKFDLKMFFRFLTLYKGIVPSEKRFEDIDISYIDNDFIRKISLSDLYAFISFAEKHRNNGTFARARKVATLKSFFKYEQIKVKVVDFNPAIDLESPKIDKRNPIYLTLDESRILLKSITGKNQQRDYCIITLFLNCGLRLSELCSIDLSKIKEDTITIIGKGNKERTIYLNNACLKSLTIYLPERNSNLNIIDADALFISRSNRRINKRTVELLVKKYIKYAGLDYNKFTPHKLRHTAATLMYKYGNVDIRSLQKILGHENISTTQIYTHVDDEQLRDAVKANPLSEE